MKNLINKEKEELLESLGFRVRHLTTGNVQVIRDNDWYGFYTEEPELRKIIDDYGDFCYNRGQYFGRVKTYEVEAIN